ncbi:MAG: hypothetical protein IKU57_00440, partial [Oscillospiraceae bacterium]|nr:hypothetical protein [Oscillospiraceae bacterium]
AKIGKVSLAKNVTLTQAIALENKALTIDVGSSTLSGETIATLGAGATFTIVSDGGELDGQLVLAADGATITANCPITLEMNGNDATVNASNVTLTDSATKEGELGGKIYGNISVAQTVTKKDGISYVAIPGSDGNSDYYTANAVRVKVKRINVRPGTAGLYYVTEVIFNRNVADLGATYGVALSLVDKPGTNFAADEDTRWTSFTAPTGANFASTGTSCIINNIMKNDGSSDIENSSRGGKEIHANAYVKTKVGNEDIVVMMENVADVNYSLKTVMQALDASVKAYAEGTGELSENAAKAVSFYEAWEGAMTQNGWNLTNMALALAKKNGN